MPQGSISTKDKIKILYPLFVYVSLEPKITGFFKSLLLPLTMCF